MKKANKKLLIDINQLEKDLIESGYNQWDIEEIIQCANDLNEKTDGSVEELNEFIFSLNESVY